MKIKIAFYAGEGNYINRIIKWWTKSPYSHAELIMPDNTWIGISPFKTSKIELIRPAGVSMTGWE